MAAASVGPVLAAVDEDRIGSALRPVEIMRDSYGSARLPPPYCPASDAGDTDGPRLARGTPRRLPAGGPGTRHRPARETLATHRRRRAFWWTERLWRLASDLPVQRVEIDDIAHFDRDCWFGDRPATCRAVAEHARLIDAADLNHPVILAADGHLMDGGHRIAKAWLQGATRVSAVRFVETPEPDWIEAPAGYSGRLVVVCGLPGSGKTTLGRRLEVEHRAIRLCPDEWMAALDVDVFDERTRTLVEQLQWQLAQRLLQLGQLVVVEWGTWPRAERDALRKGARALGAAVELRFLDQPDGVLWDRVRSRDAEPTGGRRPLTRAELEAYTARFERPDPDELSLSVRRCDPV